MTSTDRFSVSIPDRSGTEDSEVARLRNLLTAVVGDRYLIGREAGRGGAAVVFAAEDLRLRKAVALKALLPHLVLRGDVRERFVREAQMAAGLNHPHIVQVYAVHEAGGLICISMALVEGESLAAHLCRSPRPSLRFVAGVLEQVADALAYAHASGVVHRDVKPDNVLLDLKCGDVKLTDFGIACATDEALRLTGTGIAIGTPAFMSPEQAVGEQAIDGRSDIYSLGVVGYLMLTGTLPFSGGTTPVMLVQHLSTSPAPLRSVRPDVPEALAQIVERCLAKQPQDRWQSAIELRDALRIFRRDEPLQEAMPPRAIGVTPSLHQRVAGVRHSHVSGMDQEAAVLRTRRLHMHLRWMLAAAFGAVASFVSGIAFDSVLLLLAFLACLIGSLVGLLLLMLDVLSLHRMGLSLGELSGKRDGGLTAKRPVREHDARVGELMKRMADPAKVSSRYAAILHRAFDDRLVIADIADSLSPADRAMVPDTGPAADALMERIGALVSVLERLERDAPDSLLRDVRSRLAEVEAESEQTPIRERVLMQLRRQLESLEELAARRDILAQKLDSAAVALGTLRLDMAKLRTMGMSAQMDSLTGATQEARAVSRELGLVLDAVEESRRL